MRKSIAGPLLLLAVAAGGFVVAEALVRSRHPETTRASILDRIRRERNDWRRPDARFHHVGDGIFALRFAGPEEAGERRFMIVGDSFAMGHGVDGDQRFGHLLQERLGDRLRVDVLAASSYSPIIYRNIVRQALSSARYDGVAVFVDQTDPPDDLIYRNDLVPGADPRLFDVALMTERDGLIGETYDRIERGFSGWSGLARRAALFNFLRPVSLLSRFPTDTAHFDYVRLSLARPLLIHAFQNLPDDEATRTMESLLFRHLDEILHLCRERGIPMILAANPWEHQVAGGPQPSENRLESILFSRFGAEPDVTLLPLTRAFRDQSDPASLFLAQPRNEIHWNPSGHAVVEQTLRSAVASLLDLEAR